MSVALWDRARFERERSDKLEKLLEVERHCADLESHLEEKITSNGHSSIIAIIDKYKEVISLYNDILNHSAEEEGEILDYLRKIHDARNRLEQRNYTNFSNRLAQLEITSHDPPNDRFHGARESNNELAQVCLPDTSVTKKLENVLGLLIRSRQVWIELRSCFKTLLSRIELLASTLDPNYKTGESSDMDMDGADSEGDKEDAVEN